MTVRAIPVPSVAAELGDARACGFIVEHYSIKVSPQRKHLFYHVGALRGGILCRHNLGSMEYDFGNHEAGIRHWKVAAEGGLQLSLDKLKFIFNADGNKPGKEFIQKEELDKVYRMCHHAQKAIKSDDREKHTDTLDTSGDDVWYSTYVKFKC